MTPKTFDDFRKLASDKNLKPHEKVDFPKRYTNSQIDNIIEDWKIKLPDLKKPNKLILDLGCGCQLVNRLWLELSERSKLILVDSQEMLENLENLERVTKYPGQFPKVSKLFKKHKNKVDMIICYSVLQYVYPFGGMPVLYDFIDAALKLLKPGGRLLLGDLPNKSKAERFFETKEGIKFHQRKNKTSKKPKVEYTENDITDEVIYELVQDYRDNHWHEVYLLPQAENLLFKNTREDILIVKKHD